MTGTKLVRRREHALAVWRRAADRTAALKGTEYEAHAEQQERVARGKLTIADDELDAWAKRAQHDEGETE